MKIPDCFSYEEDWREGAGLVAYGGWFYSNYDICIGCCADRHLHDYPESLVNDMRCYWNKYVSEEGWPTEQEVILWCFVTLFEED